MDTVYGYPLMDSYDMFYTDNGPLDSINDAVNLPYEIDEKDHLIACHGSEQRPNFQSVLDYTPDLIPNGTPEDDPLASFDDLYVPLTSPHISSYLRYLKEPCTSVYSGGDGTTAADLSGCFFNDQSSLLPDYYRGLAPVDNSAQLQYPGLFAETIPFEDWLHDAPADMPDNTELFSTSIEGGGMTREYVSLSDVNSFVAEADSQKHAMNFSYSTPDFQHIIGPFAPFSDHGSDSEDTTTVSSSTYMAPPPWYTHSGMTKGHGPTASASTTTTRKSKSDILLAKFQRKRQPRKGSMPISQSVHGLLPPGQWPSDCSEEDDEEEEDEDEEGGGVGGFQHHASSSSSLAAAVSMQPSSSSSNVASGLRKGRNVDKACNHCKRSHLRCDNMRPCRRCVATGKTGCKDVEHKPRGRPRLNKNHHNHHLHHHHHHTTLKKDTAPSLNPTGFHL